MDASPSHAWFEELSIDEAYVTESVGLPSNTTEECLDHGASVIARGIVECIVDSQKELPPSFACDKQRFNNLRSDFQRHVAQALLQNAVTVFLQRNWGRNVQLCGELDDIINTRVQQLYYSPYAEPPPLDSVALEILRAIEVRYGGSDTLPKDDVVNIIVERLKDGTADVKELREDLCCDLLSSVRQKLKDIAGATPLHIHNYYADAWRMYGQEPFVTSDSMAQRIAHIAVLHWRVWGPIVYEQPADLFRRPRMS